LNGIDCSGGGIDNQAKESMTGSREALDRAICAQPDEDTPRLAYADLIEEEGEGDATRAAFIRAQVALARVPEFDPVHIATRQANPGAVNGHAMTDALPRPLPDGYGWHAFEFRRGFPWKVGVRSSVAFDADGAIFDVAPIQALDIGATARRDFDRLADWPHLARIRRLEFSTARFGADEAERLGHLNHTERLSELSFEFDGISAEGLSALVRSPLFARLTELDFRSNAMPPALLADALGAVREAGALLRLSLAANRIEYIDADHLFALPALQGLERLDLSDNPRLGPKGAEALAQSAITRGVRTLDLECVHPGIPGLTALAKSGALSSVRIFHLANNRLGPNAVKLLAHSEVARGLRVLNLAENPIGDAGATMLANAPALAGLLELDLADCRLSDVGARALAESAHLDGLLRLNLSQSTGPPFGPAARRALEERFGNRVTL
jgi:uncharacterized protein (TIGR02996 family)